MAQETEMKFSLFYANDQYELTTEHHKLLESIKALPDKDSLDVHIKGYTNSVGGENYNLELSRKRAENVKKELRAFTIISSQGYGELGSAAADNRRVDILVHLKRDHIPVVGEIVEEPIIERKPTIISLVNPKKGDKITLSGIRFYPDRDVIMDESREALDELVDFLKNNPKVKFKLIGHICCGDPMKPYKDVKNVRTGRTNLSEARAQALHNYLVKKGINKRRMRYLGMAFMQPTGKGDEYDRRVEIEITSVD
ncbi:OmpA family protein [Aureisphaera galaxeae]|uniref:OmpA family protein n=1 Tax=Aureisphaera galaxeae TaxID=1538023 RepID=UPI0023500289|nr:OmpA family protein [Aureisphaera galaxeae]MDC8003253.1 OmpA family protein [Aureisphaera galaxeae]